MLRKVFQFFLSILKIENVEETDFVKAYRKSSPRDYVEEIKLKDGSTKKLKVSTPGVMFVRLYSEQLRELVLARARKLGGQRHPQKNHKYFVAKVECEAVKAAKEKHSARIKTILKDNETKKENNRFHFHGNQFYVNGDLQVSAVSPPTFQEICDAIREVGPALDAIEVIKTEIPLVENNNQFRAFVVRVRRMEEIWLAYIRIYKEVPDAAHVLLAYKLASTQGTCDDGEHKGAYKILKLIQLYHLKHVAVFVSRRSNGQQLGPKRFQCIADVTKALLAPLAHTPGNIDDTESIPSSPKTRPTRRNPARPGRNASVNENTTPKTVE